MPKVALTIAGSDSCGGAGIQQDLKVFSALGVHGVSVITAITAQSPRGVRDIFPLPPSFVEKQIDVIMKDTSVESVKTGMLVSSDIAKIVREKLIEYGIENLVVDPVLVATTGNKLAVDDLKKELRKLMKLAKVSTPNEFEFRSIFDRDANKDSLMEISREIKALIVTKGDSNCEDLLLIDRKIKVLKPTKIFKGKFHGTGCAFSAAIAANLAKGLDIETSARKAKDFVENCLRRNFSIGPGLKLIDAAKIKLSETPEGEEENEIIEKLEKAVDSLLTLENFHKLIPEVGSNFVFAKRKAKSIEDVAGIAGRIIKVKNKAIVAGEITFGGSSHVARIVLQAMKFDPEIRSCINIRYSTKILDICRDLGLKITNFDRKDEPKNVKTMEWGTTAAIRKLGEVPDIIFDEGAKGKEAMIRILGKTPEEVLAKINRILKNI